MYNADEIIAKSQQIIILRAAKITYKTPVRTANHSQIDDAAT